MKSGPDRPYRESTEVPGVQVLQAIMKDIVETTRIPGVGAFSRYRFRNPLSRFMVLLHGLRQLPPGGTVD